MEKIGIIGLGLIGGSIGLAMKRAELKEVKIVGTARTRDTLRSAMRLGAIDEDASTPAEAAQGARLVIIAAPILATRAIFEEISPVLAEGAVVTDVGSTKANVMRWAAEILPRHTHFVGGHPMAGKETPGIAASDADLFREKTWVVVPSVNAPETAVQTTLGVVRICGGDAVFMDAEEHDSYVAAISHLPLTLSSALFSVAFGSQAWPELASLASSGFRDTTRLASGSPELAHDIAVTNRDNILHWLDRFQAELSRFRAIIASGESAQLIETFTRAQHERDTFMAAGAPKRDQHSGPPVEGMSFSDIFLGTKISGYLKKQQDMVRDAESREKKR